ncbi:MAG: NRAMP family divalent metal transporter [Halobacteriales archaeon]
MAHSVRSALEGPVRSYLRRLGPTWIAGAIAAGPATMATVLTAGASFRYRLLWVVVLAAVFGALAQYLAMRVGLLSERGLVSLVEDRLGSGWAWLLVVDVVLAAGLAQLVIMKTVADVSAFLTGVDARVWGVAWALALAIGLGWGGYRFLEVAAKALVAGVVVAFVASLGVVPIDLPAAAGGLVPAVPAGVDGALVAAAVLGGAVHVTLVTMQSYTMRARDWTVDDYGLGTFDVLTSMLLAFGAYGVAIYLVAAAVLYDPSATVVDIDALGAAEALEPALGTFAHWLFLLGLWGAAVSTLGGNTVVPPFALADKLGIERTIDDRRYRALIVAVALASGAGAFLEGAFFPLLVLVLAFGLVGTPFALALVVYLANDPGAVDERASWLSNLGGVVLIGVASLLAGNFVLDRWPVEGVLDGFVVAFAAVFGVATVGVAWRFWREGRR